MLVLGRVFTQKKYNSISRSSAGYTGSIAKSLEAPYFTGAGVSHQRNSEETCHFDDPKALVLIFFGWRVSYLKSKNVTWILKMMIWEKDGKGISFQIQ